MAEHGTAGLSLRGIGREMGITAPAIYNYFPRLDDLITALIVDAFTALADAIEAAEVAVQSEAPGTKILASCLAYREWAMAHPVDLPAYLRQPDLRLRGAGGHYPSAGTTAVRRAAPPIPRSLSDR